MFFLVLALNDIGILKGLALGAARVKARAIGTNPTTGQKVIYSHVSIYTGWSPNFK